MASSRTTPSCLQGASGLTRVCRVLGTPGKKKVPPRPQRIYKLNFEIRFHGDGQKRPGVHWVLKSPIRPLLLRLWPRRPPGRHLEACAKCSLHSLPALRVRASCSQDPQVGNPHGESGTGAGPPWCLHGCSQKGRCQGYLIQEVDSRTNRS